MQRHQREASIFMSHKKDKIRNISKSNREALKKDFIKQASNDISQKIITSKYFKDANNIGCYLSTEYEVSTDIIISSIHKTNKNLYVPKIKQEYAMDFVKMTLNSNMVKNKFGIHEPLSEDIIDANKLDIVVVPIVAFDEKKNRIGMGGGFYDRKFKYKKNTKNKYPLLIGVAFECQKVEKIKPECWDVKLSAIVTELNEFN
ncbi:MAG: 5-formyltetrahydrofolate cyclo-ligase [Gammaproteobacteria bacterium]|nr:MAG: 5-formyltetrahydrofolate cyclo-ligase [Gammaproteobacteria bacterium]